MFELNDKVTFTLVNIIDDEGVLLNMFYPLPLNKKIELPSNVREVSLFESHQGRINGGFVSKKFYVGKKMKLKDLFKTNNKVHFIADTNFNNSDEEVLVRISEDGTINALTKVEEGAAVVPNVDSLIVLLNYVSSEVEHIEYVIKSVQKIKELHK
jgi:hypothetical protein